MRAAIGVQAYFGAACCGMTVSYLGLSKELRLDLAWTMRQVKERQCDH